MASTVNVGGRTTAIPGSYTEVDASALARPGTGTTGVIALIGEASGGAPYTAADSDFPGYYRITNPGKVPRTFRSGDMLEAGTMLFDATSDPNIPASAQEVVFVKVNPSTPSTRTLYDGTGAIWGVVSSRDYGLHTTQVSLDIEAGTDGGKLITVNAHYDSKTEVFDNVGASAWFTVAHRISATLGHLTATIGTTTFTGTITLDAGLDFSGVVGTAGTISALGAADEPTNPWVSGVATIVSSSAADTAQAVIVYGISGGVPASESITLNGTTPVNGSTAFSRVHGIYKPATTGTVQVSAVGPVVFETLAAAETWGGSLIRATDGQLEATKGALTFLADGATTKTLLVLGSSGGSPTMEQITLSGTTPVSTTTIDWDYIVAVFGYEVENARTITLRGLLWADDTEARLVSSSTADVGVEVLVFGKDDAGAQAYELVTLNGTSAVDTATAWDTVYGFMLADQDSTAWTGTITLSTAAASIVVKGAGQTSFTLVVGAAAGKSAGRIVPMGWHVGGGQSGGGTTIAFNWAGLTGDNALIYVGEDADGDFIAESEPAGTSGTTAATFTRLHALVYEGGIGGTSSTAQSIVAWTLTNSAYTSLQAVADFFDAFDGVTFTLSTTKTSTLTLDNLDQASGTTDASAGAASFYGVGYDVAATLNAQSVYVKAVLGSSTFKGAPMNGAGIFLRGGIEGVTTFAHWQAALNFLRGVRVNSIVPLTSDSAVHAACVAHAVYMAGAGRSERDVILGAASGETLAQLKTRARELNTRHARLCVQDVLRNNTDGVREQFPPYFTACLAAGMQAGAAVGEPLTWKYMNVLGVVGNDSSYTVVDDLDEMIQAGLHVVEPVPNIGFRWARGVTTHLLDNNLAYIEASMNHAVNLAVFDFRRAMEAVVGRSGFDGTVAAAKGNAVSILGQIIAARYITNWQNLDVSLEADVLTVAVEIAPTGPVNFVLSTLHLVPASRAV